MTGRSRAPGPARLAPLAPRPCSLRSLPAAFPISRPVLQRLPLDPPRLRAHVASTRPGNVAGGKRGPLCVRPGLIWRHSAHRETSSRGTLRYLQDARSIRGRTSTKFYSSLSQLSARCIQGHFILKLDF